MSKIIALGHRSGHGKDTVADYLVEFFQERGRSVVKWPFAWKLKLIAYDLYKHLGHKEPGFYDTPAGRALRNIKLPGIDKTPVEIWIDLGEGIRDKVYTDTWRDYVRNNVNADIIICPDVRKENELLVCDVRVKVVNPRIPDRVGKSIDNDLANYVGWNYLLYNDADLTILREKARELGSTILRQEYP